MQHLPATIVSYGRLLSRIDESQGQHARMLFEKTLGGSPVHNIHLFSNVLERFEYSLMYLIVRRMALSFCLDEAAIESTPELMDPAVSTS
jgi:hypothetical protein